MRTWFNKPAHNDTTDLPLYKRRRDEFMGDAHISLYRALCNIAGQAYHVFPKVKLSELVEPEVETGNRVHQLHWIKVHSQTVDFLVCRKHDMEPLVAVRIFSKSEYAKRGFSSPDVVDTVLSDISLAKVVVAEKKNYDPNDLKQKLKAALIGMSGIQKRQESG